MVLLALCMGKFSLMRMEDACQEMSSVVRRMCGVVGRFSDNTFGRILAQLRWQELQERLWWQVRALRERKQLEHDCLPIATLALDGKAVWQTWDTTFTHFLVASQQYYPDQIVQQERMLQSTI